jgi:hypothetical protein
MVKAAEGAVVFYGLFSNLLNLLHLPPTEDRIIMK